MKRLILVFTLLFLALFFAGCGGALEEAPTQTVINPEITSTYLALVYEGILTEAPLPTPTVTPYPTLIESPPIFVREGVPPIQPEEPISLDNAYRITELARWGYGSINKVEHSKDGQFMFVQTSMSVYAYHAGTLDEVWRYEVDEGASAMGVGDNYLAIGTYSGEIVLLNIDDGSEVYSWEAHIKIVRDVAFSPDETLLASGSDDQTMRLWQIESEPPIEFVLEKRMDYWVKGVVFANAGRMILVCKYAYVNCDIVDTTSEEIIRNIGGFISLEHDIYILEDKVRRISSDELLLEAEFYELEGESFLPTYDAISNNGKMFAVGGAGNDFNILIWDLADGSLIAKIDLEPIIAFSSGHLAKPALRSGSGPYSVTSLDFSPDDRYLMIANGFGNIFIWDLEEMAMRKIITAGFRETFFSPDGNLLISYDRDEIAIFDPTSGERLDSLSDGWYSYTDYMGYGIDLHFSPDSTRLANGSRFWVIEEGERVQLPWGERALGFSEDGEFIYTLRRQWWVSHRYTYSLELYKEVSLEYPKKVEEDTYTYFSLFAWWELYGWWVSSFENTIQAVAYDTPYFVWDLDSGQLVYPQGFNFRRLSGCSDDGRFCVEGHEEGFERSLVVSEKQPDNSFEEIYIIEDGREFYFYSDTILVIDKREELVFIDLIERKRISSFDMERYFLDRRWIFSPDGTLLVIMDETEIHIWDIKNQRLLVKFEAHRENIRDLAFSPDGRYLATSSWDGTVRLWGIAP